MAVWMTYGMAWWVEKAGFGTDWLFHLRYSYTKPKGQLPDYTSPVVLPYCKTTVEDFCMKIHKNLIKDFK